MSPRASVDPERRRILALIEQQPEHSVRAIYVAKRINTTRERARRLLNSLVERGDLELTDSIEGGAYEWRLADGEEPTG